MRKLIDLLNDETGLGAIEYALVASLIAVAAIAGFNNLGNGVNDKYETIDSEIE